MPSSQPPTQPSARIDLANPRANPGGLLPYEIVNDGDTRLIYGGGYSFQEQTTDGWRPVRLELAFAAWGALLDRRERGRALAARIPEGLAPGRYRLTTHVIVAQDNGSPRRHASGAPVNSEIHALFAVD